MSEEGSSSSEVLLRRYAAVLGATGIAAGAFGAHALHDVLAKRGSLENWRTAVLYQCFHATALVGVSALVASKKDKSGGNEGLAGTLMTVGTVLFSGSIYGLCLGAGPKKVLGPTTPIGGLFMIAGWVALGM